MNDLSKDFGSYEFACKCGCGYQTPSPKLIERLQELRDAWGFPIVVNSGCRCPVHNAGERGSRNSYHLNGMAGDITVQSRVEVARVKRWDHGKVFPKFYELCKDKFDGGGIIFYPKKLFVHVDVRGYSYMPFPDISE